MNKTSGLASRFLSQLVGIDSVALSKDIWYDVIEWEKLIDGHESLVARK
jgi:hypothetical protein